MNIIKEMKVVVGGGAGDKLMETTRTSFVSVMGKSLHAIILEEREWIGWGG